MNAPRRMLYGLIAAAIIFYATPAWADGGGIGPLKTLDATDSHGIRLSQYQLSVPDQLVDPITPLVRLSWSCYTIWVGLIAHLVDWTMSLSWVTTITGPLSKAQDSIRDGFLNPIGATSINGGGLIALMSMVAVVICSWHIMRGRPAGWWGMLVSCLCAALAVGLFASPVASIAGNDVDVAKPLNYSQRFGAELSAEMVTGKSTGKDLDEDLPAEPVAASLIDVFVRPAHQALNYGVSIDANKPECVDAYDAALKAGPDEKAEANKQRQAVGKCASELEKYAENVNTNWLPFAGIFWLPALLASAVFLTVMILMWLSILNLAWTAFWLNIHAIIGIAPGATRGPLIIDLVTIAKELVYITIQGVVLSLALMFVKATLGDSTADPIQRFLTGSLLMVAMLVVVIANYVTHLRTGRSLIRRLTERTGQTVRDTLGKKGTDWGAQPAPDTKSWHRANEQQFLQQRRSHSGGDMLPSRPAQTPMAKQTRGQRHQAPPAVDGGQRRGQMPAPQENPENLTAVPRPRPNRGSTQMPTPSSSPAGRKDKPGIKAWVAEAAGESQLGQGLQRVKDSNAATTITSTATTVKTSAKKGSDATHASASRIRMLRQGATRAYSGHAGVDKAFDSGQKMSARVENARDRLHRRSNGQPNPPSDSTQPGHNEQPRPTPAPQPGQRRSSTTLMPRRRTQTAPPESAPRRLTKPPPTNTATTTDPAPRPSPAPPAGKPGTRPAATKPSKRRAPASTAEKPAPAVPPASRFHKPPKKKAS